VVVGLCIARSAPVVIADVGYALSLVPDPLPVMPLMSVIVADVGYYCGLWL
jgi:hypothetical protein